MPRAPEAPSLWPNLEIFRLKIGRSHLGYGMPADIAKLTDEAEIAQASYEALLNVYELSSGVEKISTGFAPHLRADAEG